MIRWQVFELVLWAVAIAAVPVAIVASWYGVGPP